MPEKRPIIGCIAYRKEVNQRPPMDFYGLMPSYVEAIRAAGGLPLLIPQGLSKDEMQAAITHVDGLLVPGGGDIDTGYYNGRFHRKMWGVDLVRDQTEIFLTRAAVEGEKPLFAICRGIQILNVAYGGTLWEDVPGMMPGAIEHSTPKGLPWRHLVHTVSIEPESVVGRTMGATESWVNSLHHQAIRILAPELRVTALAPDGLIEGVEVPCHPFAIGVQWHPEHLTSDPAMMALFEGLVKAAAE